MTVSPGTNAASKPPLPPTSLEVLKRLATCELIFTYDLGHSSGSIVAALESRGFVTVKIEPCERGFNGVAQAMRITADGRAYAAAHT